MTRLGLKKLLLSAYNTSLTEGALEPYIPNTVQHPFEPLETYKDFKPGMMRNIHKITLMKNSFPHPPLKKTARGDNPIIQTSVRRAFSKWLADKITNHP